MCPVSLIPRCIWAEGSIPSSELIQKLSDKWSEAPKDVGQRTDMKKRKSAARESHSKAQVDDKDVDDDAGWVSVLPPFPSAQ